MADAKKKLTKAEKDKLKKEEEEKKAEEEEQETSVAEENLEGSVDLTSEEERLRAIEEQERREKEEKILEVERQKLENEEKKCRRLDMTELMNMVTSNRRFLQTGDDARRKEAKWARYMRCDGSPDPTIQGEINTYINLKLEEKNRNDAESILKDSKLDLALIAELEFLLSDTPLEDLPQTERDRYRETIGELQHLIQQKLDDATLQVLCDASKLQDPETNNLEYTIRNEDIVVCLWGNLSKNPRIKSFDFAEGGCSFDIPRPLTLADCAVRYMHTVFDHFSAYSKAFYPRCKIKVVEEIPEEVSAEEEITEEVPSEEIPLEELPETELALGQAKAEDLTADLTVEGEDAGEEGEEVIVEEQDYDDPATPELPEWEDFDEEDNVVDLRAYQVMGGIFNFDLICLPPQPKICKNWTITQLVSPPKLEFLEYVVDAPVASGQEKPSKDKEDKDRRDEKPPITITLSLPNKAIFLEEPQLAWWDAEKQYWRTDGLTVLSYDEEKRILKFSTSRFGTLCLQQDSHINMPFQSWELRPHGVNSAVLTIIAAITELEIEIKDGLCCLSQPSDKPELAHLLNQWLIPRELIENMRCAGLNVFPAEDSSKYVTVQNKIPAKHPLVVERMYDQMPLVASAMAFSWSKWNSEVDSSKVILLMSEALRDEALLEEDWSVYMADKRRFTKLKMNEFDEEFSTDLAEDITMPDDVASLMPHELNTAFNYLGGISTRLSRLSFKSNVYHYVQANASPAALGRVNNTSVEFIDCVQQLLKATQVLTFS